MSWLWTVSSQTLSAVHYLPLAGLNVLTLTLEQEPTCKYCILRQIAYFRKVGLRSEYGIASNGTSNVRMETARMCMHLLLCLAVCTVCAMCVHVYGSVFLSACAPIVCVS